MVVREHIPLSELTTFKVGGAARAVIAIESIDDLTAALAFVEEAGLPFVVLGEGSNVLAADRGYAGAVFLMRMPGMHFADAGDAVSATIGAGESWDAFVRECAVREVWGVENLAGIPGTVGAAPVQNIGAYGAEVASVIEYVSVYDAKEREEKVVPLADCGFSYRDSRFKHEPQLVITSVTFRLAKEGTPRVEYKDLIAAREAGTDLSSPGAIGATVREVRAGKFPDLRLYGTAGSFFKNPILTQEEYDALSQRYASEIAPYGGIPLYPMPGKIKIPLAFILDKLLGMRGYRKGPTFLFGNQPLVLVAEGEANSSDIEALATEIETRVHGATGIAIEREVRTVDAHEYRNG